MKVLFIVFGIFLDLVGIVWILQGANVLTQGQMAGHSQWILIGIILAVVGTLLLVFGILRKGRARA
jgi:uncharacterized membrane protein YidH (DUF202 family)